MKKTLLLLLLLLLLPLVNAETYTLNPCDGEPTITQQDNTITYDSRCFNVIFNKTDPDSIQFYDKYNNDHFELKAAELEEQRIDKENQKHKTKFSLQNMTLTLDGNNFIYANPTEELTITYHIQPRSIKYDLKINNWTSNWGEGSKLYLRTRVKKEDTSNSHFDSYAPTVDNIEQALIVAEEIDGVNKNILQLLYTGNNFTTLLLDPVYTINYTATPGINLKGANALTTNDTNFINIDVTSTVSDNSDATSISLYKENQALTKIFFFDKHPDEHTNEVQFDDNWYTDEINVEKISDAAVLQKTTEPFKNGMKITFRLKLKETKAQGTYYLTNADDTVTYGTFSTAGAPIMTEIERTSTLTNLPVSGVSQLYLHGKDLSDDKKTYYDLVSVTDPSNASAFTGHWTQTYDPLYDWFLKVRKITSNPTSTYTYAYENDERIVSTVNVTEPMNGIGWFYVPLNNILDYELNNESMNFSSIRFFSEETASFSEFILFAETNDTSNPVITNCTVNDTFISCGETARYSCTVTDDNGIQDVTFTIGGTVYSGMKNLTTWYYDFAPIGYATTNYTLTLVNATDIFSKTTTTNPALTVNYNCTLPATPPPTITNCTVSNDNVSCEGSTIYSCNVEGNYTINNVDFIINNVTYAGIQTSNTTWAYELGFTGYEIADYTLTLVNATDILAQHNSTLTNITAQYYCVEPIDINASMNCLYDPYPGLLAEQQFLCTIQDATNKTFNCFGITKSPSDGSIYDITPRETTIQNYGASTGFTASPQLAEEQFVKIDFSNKRLKHNQTTTFEALCIDANNNQERLTYTVELSPTIKEPLKVLDATISIKQNAWIVIIGGITLLFLVGLIIWLAQKSRGYT